MREIKFKAKRVSDGEWVEGFYYEASKYLSSELKTSYIQEDKMHPLAYEVIPESVCQFTGLHDRNGKEIYEGDVFRIHEGKGDFKETHLIWDNDWCLFVPSNSELRHRVQAEHSEHYEVIGNIHDKKE